MRKVDRSADCWSTLAACALVLVAAACSTDDAGRSDNDGNASVIADSANGVMASSVPSTSTADVSDSDLASFLAAIDSYALESGRVATTRGRSASVRSLGNEIMKEHQSSLERVRQLATANTWMLPLAATPTAIGSAPRVATADDTAGNAGGTSGSLSGTVSGQDSAGAIGPSVGTTSRRVLVATAARLQRTEQDQLAHLRKLPRASFDSAYVDAQLVAHQQALGVLRQYATSVQSADLRSHVHNVQGSIERHLSRINDVRAQIGGTPPRVP